MNKISVNLIKCSYFEQLKCFMIFMLNDHHHIHAKKVPQKLRTSTAVHMASSSRDIHMSVAAVFIGEVKVCQGGIASEVVKSIMADALRSMQTTSSSSSPSGELGRTFTKSIPNWLR